MKPSNRRKRQKLKERSNYTRTAQFFVRNGYGLEWNEELQGWVVVVNG